MKQTALFLLSGLALATAPGCTKKNDPDLNATRDYQVEYRVSSPSASMANNISYTNESGGTTALNNVSLPVTYTFKRTMKQGDSSLILAGIHGGTATSEITASILLDGKEVRKETGRGPDAQAVPAYLIGQ